MHGDNSIKVWLQRSRVRLEWSFQTSFALDVQYLIYEEMFEIPIGTDMVRSFGGYLQRPDVSS